MPCPVSVAVWAHGQVSSSYMWKYGTPLIEARTSVSGISNDYDSLWHSRGEKDSTLTHVREKQEFGQPDISLFFGAKKG